MLNVVSENEKQNEDQNVEKELMTASYSEKSFVVYGSKTRDYKENLKELGGRFNSRLKQQSEYPGGPGWIFAESKREEVETFINSIGNYNTNMMQGNDIIPTHYQNSSTKSKYQTVKWRVFRPDVGMQVKINVGTNVKNGKVSRVENNDGVVDTVYINLDNGTTKAVIVNGMWQIHAYLPDHKIYFE